MKYVKVNELGPGMILASTIYDNNENIMLRANKRLNRFFIEKIRRLNYEGVYIYDDNETDSHRTILSEETRLSAVKSLKQLNIDDCIYMATQIVEEIKDNKNLLIEIINLSTYDNFTYIHSINVSMLSVILGIGYGMTNSELEKLSQAALLHDIGKTKISSKIINKPGKLTSVEYEKIKTHSYLGYKILSKNPNISAVVRNAVYSHHENEDGSGYPRKLKKEKIHIMAKIIHIADVYDALTARRAYKDAMNPADALEYLMANVGTMFDGDLVQIFTKYIALYPIGASVRLSSGEKATVIRNHRSLLSRPVVKKQNGCILDLKKELNMTIVAQL